MDPNESIYIIGHKNPDTDSIIAALAYANLKHCIGENNYIAARCGEVNIETAFLLDYFNVKEPRYIKDIMLRAQDILTDTLVYAYPDMTIRQVCSKINFTGVKTLAICDEFQKFLGIITVGDLTKMFIDAWDKGVFPDDVDIKTIMKSDKLIKFRATDLVDDIKKTMIETGYRSYPVVTCANRYLGIISRNNILAANGKNLVLVDHNEARQSITGIEQANILEIVDHHRIADIQTSEPVKMRNEPVGSTCTIISKMYAEHDITPTPQIAGILAGAIMSDTLIFKSPTTTPEDIKQAEKMGKIANIDIYSLGKQLFKAGSEIFNNSASEILLEDFKDFLLGPNLVGIGQIEVFDLKLPSQKRKEILASMNDIIKIKKYDIIILMVTDLYRGGSELIYTGAKKNIVEVVFDVQAQSDHVFLPDVMSRKKQVIPQLHRIINNRHM